MKYQHFEIPVSQVKKGMIYWNGGNLFEVSKVKKTPVGNYIITLVSQKPFHRICTEPRFSHELFEVSKVVDP